MTVPSRPLITGIIRFLLVSLLTFILLIGATLLIACVIAWLRNGEWNSPQYLSMGMVCVMIVLLFVAVFHLRRETQRVPFSQREQFVAKAKTVLQEMGYALRWQRSNAMAFRPRFHEYLFGGGIHLAVHNQEARVTGPKVSLDIFRRCFRLLNHVQHVQLRLQENRKLTENVIKRLELRLRLGPDQFEAVRKNIIEFLQQDAEVVCELNLLVQGEKGIREDILDFRIREWLHREGIHCEIHKDLVHFAETVHPEFETEAGPH
jgi:hypothetical protein